MLVFISYSRRKDQFGAICSFCDHFAQELQMLAPSATLFLDTKVLEKGDDFPSALAKAVASSEVFLPIISPSWFVSHWCRKEYSIFVDKNSDRGASRNILPVLWADTPELKEDSIDSIARDLARINYLDWRAIRHEPIESTVRKKAIAELASCVAKMLKPPKLSANLERILLAVATTGSCINYELLKINLLIQKSELLIEELDNQKLNPLELLYPIEQYRYLKSINTSKARNTSIVSLSQDLKELHNTYKYITYGELVGGSRLIILTEDGFRYLHAHALVPNNLAE